MQWEIVKIITEIMFYNIVLCMLITSETEIPPPIKNRAGEISDDENGSLSEFEDDDQVVIDCDDRGPLVSNSDILSRSSFK